MTDYLDLEDLLSAAEAALGHPPEVGDVGLLEAALARPRATVFGAEAYADFDAKAASLLHSLVTGHALVDGNKRLGWVATRLFYRLNDRDLQVDPDQAFDLIASIADGSVRDVAAITEQLARWSHPTDPDPRNVTARLDAIPGASNRTSQGAQEAQSGQGVPLEDLEPTA